MTEATNLSGLIDQPRRSATRPPENGNVIKLPGKTE